MLLGGEPGGGKSNALNLIVAHGALSADCKLILVDGKQVELGPWRHCADMFIGPSINDAIDAFDSLPADHEHPLRQAAGRRRAGRSPASPASPSTWSSSTNTPTSPPPSAPRPTGRSSPRWPATWSPGAAPPGSSSSWPPSGRPTRSSTRPCGTCSPTGGRSAAPPTPPPTWSSATGWAGEGYTAAEIDPLARGVGWLLSETGIPRRIKAAYLTDADIADLAAYAAQPARPPGRGMTPHTPSPPCPPPARAPACPQEHCQRPLDTQTAPAGGGERRLRRVRPPHPDAPTPAASPAATSKPSPS